MGKLELMIFFPLSSAVEFDYMYLDCSKYGK